MKKISSVCIMVSVRAAVKQCDDCFNWCHREYFEDMRDKTDSKSWNDITWQVTCTC